MGFSPPPFSAQQAPKNNAAKTILIVFGVLGLFCLIACGGFIFMGMNVMGQAAPLAACAINSEMTFAALRDYATANGGKLPPAATWTKDIEKYYSMEKLNDPDFKKMKENPMMKDFFNMPVPGQAIPCMAAKGSDKPSFLVFNLDLAGKKLADIPNPSSTVILFESQNGAYNFADSAGKPRPKSPYKIMGQPRDWFLMMADGNGDGGSGSSFKVNTNP